MIFYSTNCPIMELREPPYNGSTAIYPTVLCMWKLIIWNHQYEPLPLVYHKVPYWAHFFFWFTWTISRTKEISTIEYTLPTHTSNVNELLNNELVNIYEWLTVNRLSLNLTQTKYLIFYPIQKNISSLVPTVIINGIQIEKGHNFNFLGICLDTDLKWDGHIKLLASKLGKYSGILNKLKRYIPIDILLILYCSMVNSHLNYAILGWGFACSCLKKMQKRIIRIITRSKYKAHTSPIFKSLRILKLDHMLR